MRFGFLLTLIFYFAGRGRLRGETQALLLLSAAYQEGRGKVSTEHTSGRVFSLVLRDSTSPIFPLFSGHRTGRSCQLVRKSRREQHESPASTSNTTSGGPSADVVLLILERLKVE